MSFQVNEKKILLLQSENKVRKLLEAKKIGSPTKKINSPKKAPESRWNFVKENLIINVDSDQIKIQTELTKIADHKNFDMINPTEIVRSHVSLNFTKIQFRKNA